MKNIIAIIATYSHFTSKHIIYFKRKIKTQV